MSIHHQVISDCQERAFVNSLAVNPVLMFFWSTTDRAGAGIRDLFIFKVFSVGPHAHKGEVLATCWKGSSAWVAGTCVRVMGHQAFLHQGPQEELSRDEEVFFFFSCECDFRKGTDVCHSHA